MSIFGGNTSGSQAGMLGALMQGVASQQAQGTLQNTANNATADFNTNYYQPYTDTGTQANTMYANALGLNGAAGNTAATNAFQSSPGYQWQLGQGTQAVDRGAAAGGTFGSGNAAIALQNYGQGLANQDYNNWLNNVSGLNSQGLAAATGQTGREQSLANIQTGLGQAQAGVIQNTTNQAVNDYTGGVNADATANNQGQANMFSALLGGANLGLKASGVGGFAPATSSDENDKTDITPLGEDENGVKQYAYRYKSDPKTYPKVVGPMAQDIEKKDPSAVKKIGGHKVVAAHAMYHAATKKKVA